MRCPHPKNSRLRAFTLVELVVAMGILVSIFLLVGVASATFYKSWTRSTELTAQLREYQGIDRLMDSCVRTMIPYRWNKNTELTQSNYLVFDGGSDVMHFVTVRRAYDEKKGAFLFIRLFLENGSLVAEYSPFPRIPWEIDSSLVSERDVLASGVRRLAFEYGMIRSDPSSAAQRTVEWTSNWDRDSETAIPAAVQMTVEWEDGRSVRWLRRTAGASANSVFLESQNPTTAGGS